MISGERILVTGVTGTIGSALALHLAAENDVWGVARFADSAIRAKETFTAVATPSPTGVPVDARGARGRRGDAARDRPRRRRLR